MILACNLNFQVNTTLGVKRILEMPATLTFFFYLTDFFWRVLSNTMGFLERDFSFFSSRLTLMARLHARRWYVANFLPRCHKFNSIQFSWNGRWHFLWSQNDSLIINKRNTHRILKPKPLHQWWLFSIFNKFHFCDR